MGTRIPRIARDLSGLIMNTLHIVVIARTGDGRPKTEGWFLQEHT